MKKFQPNKMTKADMHMKGVESVEHHKADVGMIGRGDSHQTTNDHKPHTIGESGFRYC